MSIAPILQAPAAALVPEELHPALWRASQLARSVTRCVKTSHPVLTTNLPGGGWPMGTIIDLHVMQAGIAEIRLVAPALRQVAARKIVFISPPHQPQILSLAGMGLAPENLIWLRPKTSADALWAAQTVLASGSCGAVLMWSPHTRTESMRRLNLAAQTGGETLFFMLRPLAAAQDASPAPLRLALRPAPGGIEVTIVKRKGPQCDKPLIIPLPSMVPVKGPAHPIRERERVKQPQLVDLIL